MSRTTAKKPATPKVSADARYIVGSLGSRLLAIEIQLRNGAAQPPIAVAAMPKAPARILQDEKTGELYSLEWAKPFANPMNWEAADKACRELREGGHTDWRLPNVRELESLVDRTRHNPASADPLMKSEWYWTSEPWKASSSGYAWYVFFSSGYVSSSGLRYGSGFVRACRRVLARQ